MRAWQFPLSSRNLQPELMDDEGLDEEIHRHALRGLARVNRVSSSSRLLWNPIRRLSARTGTSSWRVLDIASGGGDVAVALWSKAAAAGVSLDIVGCDISPTAVDYATQASKNLPGDIRFEQRDVFTDPPSEMFDIVTSSLFLHHQTLEGALTLLQTMSSVTRRLLLVNDLVRSRWGYWLAKVGCQLLTRSPIVHVDGPQSVVAAFTIPEVEALCSQVPLNGARISSHWPARFLLEWAADREV